MQDSGMVQEGVSRRNFLKGALLGGVALTMADRLALAEQMLTGRTALDIRSVGLEAARVDLASNENPIGASSRAIQAVADHITKINRYTRDNYELEYELIEALAAYDGVTLPEKKEPEGGLRTCLLYTSDAADE